QQMPDGHFSNLYTVKVVNKTARAIAVEFKLENIPGDLFVMSDKHFSVQPRKLAETSVLIELDQANMKPGQTPLVVGVYADGKKVETLKTSFIGPRLQKQ
ncbi:MAG: cytochrome c oxidase accessory protein CcoG, partial [Akkermansiaceae bacterium]|nr:cytochrome c oxidase accessory protein CcoG [Verrucomicrobiales bacterium]